MGEGIEGRPRGQAEGEGDPERGPMEGKKGEGRGGRREEGGARRH